MTAVIHSSRAVISDASNGANKLAPLEALVALIILSSFSGGGFFLGCLLGGSLFLGSGLFGRSLLGGSFLRNGLLAECDLSLHRILLALHIVGVAATLLDFIMLLTHSKKTRFPAGGAAIKGQKTA